MKVAFLFEKELSHDLNLKFEPLHYVPYKYGHYNEILDKTIKEMDSLIEKTFSCDNGKNIHIGDNFTGNFNLTILDVREVYIGDNVMIGPNTLITTVGHPLSPKGRRTQLAIAEPVTIKNDVWIGGNVTILPGVTIGENVVIGAGAVVTKDILDNSLALGVPAKVVRKLEK